MRACRARGQKPMGEKLLYYHRELSGAHEKRLSEIKTNSPFFVSRIYKRETMVGCRFLGYQRVRLLLGNRVVRRKRKHQQSPAL